MNVKIYKQDLKVEIQKNNGEIVKQQELSKEDYGSIMRELAGDDVEVLRTITKLFKPKTYTFKGVKL